MAVCRMPLSSASPAAQETDQLRLIVDAHVSLALAAGAALNVKSGKKIEIEQRTGGRQFWSPQDEAHDREWPRLVIKEEVLDDRQEEVALAIGLTHDISAAVSAFVDPNLHQVGRILHCRLGHGASQHAVRCGRHAWDMAESIVQRLQELRGAGRRIRRVHIFMAGPNGFAFFLGQHQTAMGRTAVYEWDFEGGRGHGYSLGVVLGE